MNTIGIIKSTSLLWIILTFLVSGAFTQVTVVRNVNIWQGIENGSITAVSDPVISAAELPNVFDGDPFTKAVLAADSLSITLEAANPIEFQEAKVFFWNEGNWSLEVANSMNDLENQIGSYQLLVNERTLPFFAWDSLNTGEQSVTVIRLTTQKTSAGDMFIGDWALETTLQITGLRIEPYPPKLIPNTNLQTRVRMVDENGRAYPYSFDDPLNWSSSNPGVATAAGGTIHGVALGTAEISVSAESLPLSGTATASVVTDFVSERAPSRAQRVALVIENPITDNGQRLHQRFGWANPRTLVSLLIEEFYDASDGMVTFVMVDTIDDQQLFTRYYGELISVDSLTAYYSQPGWPKLQAALQAGQLYYDYRELIDYYDLCTRRNNDEFDEVWVYAHPYAGMYESTLAGPNAFWWNSPPLTGTSCERLLSIMGFNYERGVAEAMHSVGHRAESALREAFGRWDIHHPEPNNWELFTTIDKEVPGQAHVGNIHFPHNGQSDYDYANTAVFAPTYAQNWKRYPYLLDEVTTANCSEFGCGHLNYMSWWFGHLPRYTGLSDSVLNDWWAYFLDYEAAVDSALALLNGSVVGFDGPGTTGNEPVVRRLTLEQNYPNPFNPRTVIRFQLPAATEVKLTVFDLLGREVETLVSGRLTAGSHDVTWDASRAASGIYFYRLTSGTVSQTRKMVLLR